MLPKILIQIVPANLYLDSIKSMLWLGCGYLVMSLWSNLCYEPKIGQVIEFGISKFGFQSISTFAVTYLR